MSNIENFDIKSQIIASIVDVFDAMVSLQIEPSDSEPQTDGDTGRVVAGVDFGGSIAGMLNIQVTTDFARQMTAKTLGIEPGALEGDGEIKDLLSEVSNIVGGNLKSALNDAGFACTLSTPSMTYGGDFSAKSLNMERFERFVFRHQQDWVIVEVGLKTQQGAADGEGPATADTLPGQLKDVDALQAETNTPESQDPSDTSPVTAAEAPDPPQEQISKPPEDVDLGLLLDIPLEIKVELGRAKIKIQELLNLSAGSAVKLIKLEGEPVDILANDTLIARGEVVVQHEKYGIRVTQITSRLERIRSFGF
jgi:flagellar motor switch protein FliN/FliY